MKCRTINCAALSLLVVVLHCATDSHAEPLQSARPAVGDSVDQAEAKRRGVPVQEVLLEKAQTRIKELEGQVASLQKQLAAKTQSAVTTQAEVTLRPIVPPEFAAKLEKHRPAAIKIVEDALAKERALLSEDSSAVIDPKSGAPRVKNAQGKVAFQSDRAKAEAIKKHKEEIAVYQEGIDRIKDRSITPFPRFSGEIRVGDIGEVSTLRIMQVIDRTNALVTITPEAGEFKEIDVWLEGMDTTNLADDQLYRGTQRLMFTGTKKYSTAGGTERTVLKGEVVRMERVEK